MRAESHFEFPYFTGIIARIKRKHTDILNVANSNYAPRKIRPYFKIVLKGYLKIGHFYNRVITCKPLVYDLLTMW